MKKYLILSLIIFFSMTIIFIGGCKKDSESPLEVENPDIPGVMMTFSAIAYVAEGQSDTVIKKSIESLLADTSLAPGGQWQLVWGPGISPFKENLVYVVKKTTGSKAYAIAIRGTNVNSISDIIEDFDILKMVEFPYGINGDSVTHGSMVGFNKLLEAKDPVTSKKLEDFLVSISFDSKIPLFVTGHSQGGGLAPLMSYWLVNNDKFKDKFVFTTYAFARPGFVNKRFKDNFLNILPDDASYIAMVNSLDMVPYGYSNLPGIIENNVPVDVPLAYKILISFGDDLLVSNGLKYYNIVDADTIGYIPITSTGPGGILPSDGEKWYDHWLIVEHNHNNYLTLLGVKPLN